MEVRSTRYYVEWFGKNIWDTYLQDEKSFDTEKEALAFIKHELAPDSRIKRAILTTTKNIYFTDED